jgi:hypothetical protein
MFLYFFYRLAGQAMHYVNTHCPDERSAAARQ